MSRVTRHHVLAIDIPLDRIQPRLVNIPSSQSASYLTRTAMFDLPLWPVTCHGSRTEPRQVNAESKQLPRRELYSSNALYAV